MAVLVEAISVIIRRKAIERSISGGWPAFVRLVPNRTLCFDDDLARVGFLSPPEVDQFIGQLEQAGLTFLESGRPADLTIVEQLRGPTLPTEWLEFARMAVGEGSDQLSSCWLFEGPRMAVGIHMPGLSVDIATPAGWVYEGSLSHKFMFNRNEIP